MKRKCIIKALSLLLCIATSQEVCAQWAGPDQEILRNEDNTQTVALRVENYDPSVCYVWSGPNILGDSVQPTILVNPQNETQTYICTRTGSWGVEQDAVVVTVLDRIKIVKVIPHKNCYQPGDFININDFDIETKPKEFKSWVCLRPQTIPFGGWISDPLGRQYLNVEFFIPKHDTVTVPLTGIYSDASINSDIGAGEIVSFFRKVSSIRGHISRAIDLQRALGNISSVTSPPSWSWSDPTVGTHWDCCNENVTLMAHIKWGGFTYSTSAEFYTPPLLFGCVYASIAAQAQLSLGQSEFDISFDGNCAKATLGIGIFGAVSGSVGVAALNPRLLSVQGGIEGSVSANGQLVLPDMTLEGDAKLECALVAKVTAVSLTIWEGRKVIGVIPIHL